MEIYMINHIDKDKPAQLYQYKNKEYRFKMDQFINRIYQKMVSIGIQLNTTYQDKQQYLRTKISEINQSIKTILQNINSYYGGLLFPFKNKFNQYFSCIQAFQIDQKNFKIFKTKKRCPYLIFIKFLIQKNLKLNQQEMSQKSFEKDFEIITADQLFAEVPKYKQCVESVEGFGIIVKADDDIRQQILILQLMRFIQKLLKPLNIFLRPYQIFMLKNNSGFIEFIENTSSIDFIKKTCSSDLSVFFQNKFEYNLDQAKQAFVSSLVGYSIFTYLFLVKDRHNGNILMDKQGHIIHIDFSYICGCSPGNLNFESSPFKLTEQYVLIMNGLKSHYFKKFKEKMVEGFIEIAKHKKLIVNHFQIFRQNSDFGFKWNKQFNLDDRIPQHKQEQIEYFIDQLICKSYQNKSTFTYDRYQKYKNGIFN